MTPIKTQQYLSFLLNNSIGLNLVAFLINMPTLGVTNSPTDDQLLLIRSLTMVNAVAQEISSVGYQRYIVNFPTGNIVATTDNISVPIISTFTNTTGNSGPATHICYARGANIIGATSSNGFNRGDNTGTLIQVEPLVGTPLTIQQNTTFTHTTTFTFNVSLS